MQYRLHYGTFVDLFFIKIHFVADLFVIVDDSILNQKYWM